MKTIIFDFDGTLTKKNNEIWDKISNKLDTVGIDNMLYKKFYSGELTYSAWCKENEKVYKERNFNSKILDEIISNIEMMDNIDIALKKLKEEGYDLCILSGGIDYVIKNLLKDNIKYFRDIKANQFIFEANGNLKEIKDTDSDEEGKGRYILKLIKETGCSPKDIIFVGNGHNDRFVSSTGCITICINPNGTNHLDKNIWNLYIENTDNLLDLVEVINQLKID